MGRTTKGPLRAAVIGVGYLGRFHAQKYRLIDNVQLVGVAEVDPVRGKQVAAELGVPWFADYRDLLPLVEAVSICVPTQFHYRITEACLEAGLHVLVEKPITVTLNEADELIALAESHHRVLQVGHLKRFHPAVAALKRSGVLRPLHYIESQRLAPFKPRALDVDVVLDLMIHDVDLILNFVGSELATVEAVGSRVITDQVDVANARLTFQNGCVANLTASRISRDSTRRIRLIQDDAFISLDFITKDIVLLHRGEHPEMAGGVRYWPLVETRLAIEDYDTLEAEIRAFCESVLGGTPPLVSGRDGRKALEVVSAIRLAMGCNDLAARDARGACADNGAEGCDS
ncbi:MAG: Gfo/Idh/MocA family oxidoreductase [Magnetococcales bacterium]|nr:Gfo/Idh/MocA family oxidoreductase [Magnetococcales bacterium]